MAKKIAMAALWLVVGALRLAAQPVQTLSVQVQTANVSMAGTDNDVTLVLLTASPKGLQERAWNLDNQDDNFEQGKLDTFAIGSSLPAQICDIKAIGIRKSPDDSNGGWKLAWFKIIINGTPFYTGNVNGWLEDDARSWGASDFKPVMCPPPMLPLIDLGTPPLLPPCTVEVVVIKVEIPTTELRPDADCDGVEDGKDNDFSPPDTDKDGIPDRTEDWDGDGVVDPGETDPKSADSDGDGLPDPFDLADADQDCLADLFEDKNRNGAQDDGETNWQDNDSDDDGWFDGFCNVRTTLYLTFAECSNEEEDLGDDELFLTFNHTRLPEDSDVAGVWEFEGGDSIGPLLEVARRTKGIGQGTAFSIRIDVREEDLIDWSDDDFILDRDMAFSENMTFILEHNDEGFWDTTAYKFHFTAVSDWFADPTPMDGAADKDSDGLTEKVESDNAGSLAGMADPSQPDIYMELDVVGEEQMPERYTREDIASIFSYKGFAFHLDDGVFGGGQILAENEEELALRGAAPSVTSLRTANFAASRCGVWRYVIAAYDPEPGFGQSDRVVKDTAGTVLCGSGDIMMFQSDDGDIISDFESIVWVHEFGHTLGLCHLPGDNEAMPRQGRLHGQLCVQPAVPLRALHHERLGRFGDGRRRLVPLGRRHLSGHRPRARLLPGGVGGDRSETDRRNVGVPVNDGRRLA